jgi:predicted phage-related endonuclease
VSTESRLAGIGMSDADYEARRNSIGGSDARIIMSGNAEWIHALWLEKRGLVEREDLSDNVLVQLGNVTEPLNIHFFERRTGLTITDEQKKARFDPWPIARCTLDGLVRKNAEAEAHAVFESKFMLPFNWTLDKAREKYFAQLQHNMMVCQLPTSYISIITGGGGFDYLEIEADVFYQHQLLEAEKDFWNAVQTGESPIIAEVQAPIVPTRVVDMSTSNYWADLAFKLKQNKDAADNYETAKKEIKTLMPPDAKEAFGHGIKVNRSKDNRLLIKVAA